MPKPRATSSTTSSGSTITYVCTLHWVICRPMYTNANRQPNHLSTCPKTLDHYKELFTFMVDLLKSEPSIGNGRKAHIKIADRARTQEAAASSFDTKNWNKTANQKNASF